MRGLDVFFAILLVVGGLNWGAIAFFDLDLVALISGLSFGEANVLSKVIYGLVGISAVYQALFLKQIQHRWNVN